MIITTIKLSQEINFNGMPTWIGLEGSLSAGEDEKEGLRSLQKSITDYVKEEQEKLPKPTWMPKAKAEGNKNSKEQQIATTIEAINGCTRKESVEIFRKLVERESNPSLTEAFDNKLKEFK